MSAALSAAAVLFLAQTGGAGAVLAAAPANAPPSENVAPPATAGASATGAASPDLDVQSHASPNVTVDAQGSTDFLFANSVNDEPGAGEPVEMTSSELGLRATLYATAVARHIHLDVDYQGRQPLFGNALNSSIHLLHRAELSADFLDKTVFVGVGRFLAPSAVMLHVDGARAKLNLWRLELQAFGGRRAITSTRSGNVELSTFLPAAGAAASLIFERASAEVGASFAKDQAQVSDDPTQHAYDQLSAYARLSTRPCSGFAAGLEIATAQRATYVLGPTWADTSLRTRSADVFYGYFFADLRPLPSLRVTYDFHFQQAHLYRADPNDDDEVVFLPRFYDNRLRVRFRPFKLGWLGPDVRFRVRPDRNELRVGGRVDLAPSWAKGFTLRASYFYEAMFARTPALQLPADRSYWSASVGWRWQGLDLALGVSNVQRSTLPLSGRVYTPYDDTPDKPADLSPFMLEAQRLAFVRAFWGTDLFFLGLDFEQSLTDGRERRVFAPLGARLEKRW